MQITWGHKITLAFIVFAAFILYMVSKMLNTQVDLVEKDYYAKEIKFQNQIDKHHNVLSLGDSAVSIEQDDQFIKINIQKSNPLHLSVSLYYPADAKYDTTLQFENISMLKLDKKHFHKGRTKLKLEWKDDLKEYYFEKELLIY